jgi:hypothetical protein
MDACQAVLASKVEYLLWVLAMKKNVDYLLIAKPVAFLTT